MAKTKKYTAEDATIGYYAKNIDEFKETEEEALPKEEKADAKSDTNVQAPTGRDRIFSRNKRR